MLLLCGREVSTEEFNHMDGLKEVVGLRGLRYGEFYLSLLITNYKQFFF